MAPPSLRQSKSNLLEAVQDVVAEHRTKAAHAARAQTGSGDRRPFRLILLVLILAGIVVLAIRPVWLTGPALPAETSSIRHATATLTLVNAMSHVNAYLEAQGKLPGSLRDVGIIDDAITYTVQSENRYSLTLPTADSKVTVSSTDSLKPLVITALRALPRRS